MGIVENTTQKGANPFLIPGVKFFSNPTATTRSGNLYTEKLTEDFHNDPMTGYHIPFVPINEPGNRKLRVVTIGAGLTGIMLAYNIEKHTPNVEHVVYEKNPEIGGTWYQNRYPSAACDTPTCTYQFNFAISPDWDTFYSGSEYLYDYINRVADKLDLRKYITFHSRVIEARFDKDKGVWELKIEQTRGDGTKKIITDDCDLLLGAVGILDRWEMPSIPGLDTFKGRVIHTADRKKWDEYTKDKWANETVAVIGSGASSLQTVPGMQPYVKKIEAFVRTPPWFFAQPQNSDSHMKPQTYRYTEEEKVHYASDKDAMMRHVKANENTMVMLQHIMVKHNIHYQDIKKRLTDRTREFIKDDEIFDKIIPNFSVGCRRIAPGDAYMLAIQKPNVEMHFCGVSRITESGVIDVDGNLTTCDTIVAATGFDVSYRPPFPLIGLDGIDLRKEWGDVPEAYFGLMAPKIPNYMMYLGPNSPVENGSITGLLEGIVNYTIKCIKKMQTDNIKYFVPKQQAVDDFNKHTQSWFKGTVWEEDCNAWYKNRKTGRVDAIWPGSALHFRQAIDDPRWEDMDITYHNSQNRFEYLGYGFSAVDLDPDMNADRSPYLTVDNFEPRFYK